MYCVRCGRKLKEGYSLCTGCGMDVRKMIDGEPKKVEIVGKGSLPPWKFFDFIMFVTLLIPAVGLIFGVVGSLQGRKRSEWLITLGIVMGIVHWFGW